MVSAAAANDTHRSFAELLPDAIDTGVRSFDRDLRNFDRQAWLDARLSGWGASEVPALLGFDKRKSPLAVYAEKMGRSLNSHTDKQLELMRWGNRFELPILEEYAERTHHQVEQVGALLRSKKWPWMLSTLDGFDWTEGTALEVKTFGWWASQDWEAEKEGGVPRYVFCQVQMQLAVTGLSVIPVLALPLNERALKVIPVERHQDFLDIAIEELDAHWDRFQRGHLPEPDGHETTRDALDAIYSKSSGETITLGPAWVELSDEYERLNAEVRAADKRKELIKNTLRAELKDAGYGAVGDGRSWSLLNAAGPRHTCSSCGHVDRSEGGRRVRLSGKKRS